MNNHNQFSKSSETIAQLFSRIVGQYPDKIAIKSGSSTITYQDLDIRSSKLANLIVHIIGLNPQPIGLLVGSKIDMIVAILGVIKSGHFYCALSTKDSIDRTKNVLDNLDAKILIVDRESTDPGKWFSRFKPKSDRN